MATATEGRVAVYIDFDNIVISRYNQIHGDGKFQKDKARFHIEKRTTTSPVGAKLATAKVDVNAIIAYASSFGTVALSRAYADWSAPVNYAYNKQFVSRAIELVQLFPLTVQMKNGADIRLAVDLMEDLFRYTDLTHVVIVSGDSDYVALAQRARTLGRTVVGVGVAGGTSIALDASCDKFQNYDDLPGLKTFATMTPENPENLAAPAKKAPTSASASASAPVKKKTPAPSVPAVTTASSKSAKTSIVQTAPKSVPKLAKAAANVRAAKSIPVAPHGTSSAPKITALTALVRAMRVLQKGENAEWLNNSAVRVQLLQMYPSSNESSNELKSHQEVIRNHSSNVETRQKNGVMQLRLRSNVPQPK